MSDRLKAGARADLLELAKIPFVKSRTARVLWDSGFRSLMAVAEADAKDLLPILILAQPKKAKIYGQDDLKYHQKLMLKAEIIVGAANRLWSKPDFPKSWEQVRNAVLTIGRHSTAG